MKKRLAVSMTLIATLSVVLHAYQWPLSPLSITSFFGTPQERDSVRSDLRFTPSGENSEVFPFAQGTVIFSSDKRNRLTQFPSRYNSMMILHHEDGFRSYYGGLEALNNDKSSFDEGETIGVAGETLFFKIEDIKRENFINPVILIGQLPGRSSTVIEGLYLEDESGDVTRLISRRTFPTGRYRLLGVLYNSYVREDRRRVRIPPFGITVLHNREISFDLKLESVDIDGSVTTLSSSVAIESLYNERGQFLLGYLDIREAGQHSISLVLENYASEKNSRRYLITAVE